MRAAPVEIETALEQLASEVATGRGSLRLAALATVAGHEPQVRHVIIRRYSLATHSLVFFCRADDAKFGEIASNPAVELVSYARNPDRQIRLAGTAISIADATELDRLWSQVSPTAQRDYVIGEEVKAARILDERAPLFRAVAVSIRRIKVLTFEHDHWIERSFIPAA